MLVLPPLRLWTKRTWTGMANIPRTGGVIIVPNHVSHFDPLVVAHYLYNADRWPRFLGKASLWRVPVVGPLLNKTLQIPVERGSVEAVKSLDTLVDAVTQGGVVVIYPEGTTTKQPDLWPMRGKTGAARLALLTGAPVVPLANWGAQQVFDPRTSKLKLRLRTPVQVTSGPAIDLSEWAGATPSRQVLEAMTDKIMRSISALVGELRHEQPPATLFDRPGTAAAPTSGEDAG
ncbi:1-acyl-sn-glycerol-3-phosphate acyltransferase [Actinoplanes sp. TBRC 11911]|uniref:lysophospholipid acyltransferase family protein n=1 Tax=Actinoplanes sp. TBRC 11911 TaxID=2729386 RepID=UPI00145DDA38|nr:lysophospholipid acyltransferase family protein [Actinoplanes sp. TBRC 11911]NMO52617.1 1-acyl-sn-glycerol-3-phosphate acyltransferase [Actinoplanes sp. TBRC 11911]